MPQKKQAIKDLRQSRKRAAINKTALAELSTLLKKTRKAIVAATPEAVEMVQKSIKALDKAAQAKRVKKNTVSRTKSRLMLALAKTTKK